MDASIFITYAFKHSPFFLKQQADEYDFPSNKKIGEVSLVSPEFLLALFWLLKDTKDQVTEEVVLAAEKVIELEEQNIRSDVQQKAHREMHYLDELLLREYSATECSPEMRKRILNIIDKMLKLELYGADKVIEEHERL